MHIKAPWTPEQVEQLNKWQNAGYVHPFTCGSPSHIEECKRRKEPDNDGALVATTAGWECPCFRYTQNWCHDFMQDPDILDKLNPKHSFNG